jgi:glycosyltransferase involved in cell wall biosynthesis
MEKPKHRLSIGLPVYNGEAYLEQAFKSILSQSYEDFDLIVSDNASTDRTHAICLDYAAQDSRIILQRNEVNLGAAQNFNLVYALARGEYFKWAAHDDLLAPQFLERCVAALDRDPSLILCYSKAARIDDQGYRVGVYDFPMDVGAATPHQRFHDLVLINHFCIAIFGVFRREILRETPLIAPYVGSDRILLAELGLRGRFHELPDYLFFRRDHPNTSGRSYSIYHRLAWFDPQKGKQPYLPYWKTGAEFLRAVQRVPLSVAERYACESIVIQWHIRRRKQLLEDLKASALYGIPYFRSVVQVAKNLSGKNVRGGNL